MVGAVSSAQTWRALAGAELPCDVVELRVDALEPADRRLPEAIPCPKPLLLTLRHESEGGLCRWHEAERRALAEALLPAAAMLDWEIARLAGAEKLLAAAAAAGVGVVASAHYFHGMPELHEMRELESRALDAGAAVVKIAFTPRNADDVQRGLEFLATRRMPAAIMGMGAYGPESRALYTAHGSALLYGYLGEAPTAPGQLSALECMRMRDRHTRA